MNTTRLKQLWKQLLMKRLNLSQFCSGCGKYFESFDENSQQEIYTRRYVGGKGHLVTVAYHKDCLMEDLAIDFLFSGKYNMTTGTRS